MRRNIIRVIDFETTGLEPSAGAEVCEVGICDLDVDARTVEAPESWLCGVSRMPPEARAVHHISLSECHGRPRFDPTGLFSGREPCVVIAAHNSEFETKFFAPSVPVICTYKSALRVWPEAPGHSNATLRYWLEDRGRLTLIDRLAQPAHRAGPDAYVTAHVLLALLAAGATGREMVAWTREPCVLPRCPIGNFRGWPWSDVEFGFLKWMARHPTMEPDYRWNAEREIKRRAADPVGT